MPDEQQTFDRVPGYVSRGVSGRVVADDQGTFRATVRTVRFDHVIIEVVRSAPHRYTRSQEDVDGTTEPKLTVFVVGEGTCTGRSSEGAFEARAGDVFVYDSTTVIDVHWTAARFLRCMMDTTHLPDYVLQGPPLPIGALPRTALVNSTIAFLSALVAENGSGERTPQLVQAIADLLVELLSEVRGVLAHEPGSAGLRFRVEAYVTEHFGERELAPGTIATALGVSLRSVHHAFEGHDVTVAKLIRDVRLDAVATELRKRRGAVPMAELAERHGFGSRDQLARSFRQRYGSTMKEYRTTAALDAD